MADEFAEFSPVAAPSAKPGTDEFSEFGEAGTSKAYSMGELAGTAGTQAIRGGLETSGFVGGAMLGAKAGTAAAPFLGPLAPAAPFVGGLVGGIGGALAGSQAASGLGIQTPEQLEPGLRPAAYAGQSFGGAMTMTGGTMAAAQSAFRFGSSTVGNYLNLILETAKTQPVRFMAAEVSPALSAAAAAGISEAVAPGRADIRANAEFAGGLLNPTRIAVALGDKAFKASSRAVTAMTGAGRETAAAKILADLTVVTGEDPVVLARILRQQGLIPDGQLTAAQKTGSMALGALEDHLTNSSAKFGKEAADKASSSLDVVRGQLAALAATGDPQALRVRSEILNDYYRTLIQARLDDATTTAAAFARGISADTPDARAALSVRAREVIDQAITESRRAETDLWSKVDGTRAVATTNLQQQYDEIVRSLLPEVRNEKTPKVVRDFLNRVTKPKQPSFNYDPATLTITDTAGGLVGTDVKEMRQLRSELLDMARTSTNAGEFGQARIYSNLAEAVMDDMDAAFRETGDKTYEAARSFSRQFNDVFTRSFVGKATAQGKYGDRVAPEILMRKALASGKEAGSIQLQELEEASRFMLTQGLGDSTSVNQMLDVQERIIRLAAADAVDPQTGIADPAKLSKFVRDNSLLMRRFPEVRNDIMGAVTSEAARKRMQALATNQIDVVMKQKEFSKILRSDPVTAATKALMAPNQEEALTALVKVASATTNRRGVQLADPKDAVDGLRASILTAALQKSTVRKEGVGVVLDPALMKQFLFTSTRGGKSPIQIMQENNVIAKADVDNMRKLFDVAEAIGRSRKPGTAIEVKTDLTDAAIATISRMIGSGVAGASARAVGSNTPSLIVHGAGARLAETAMTKIPTQKSTDVLIAAANDPQFMAILLEKASKLNTAELQARQARQIHAWLVQSGLTGAEAFVPSYEEEPEPVELLSFPR